MKHIKIGFKIGVVFCALTVLTFVVSALVFVNLLQISKATSWSDHTFRVMEQIDKAGTSMVDQETGVRGYLVSGNANFLEPFRNGRSGIGAAVAEMATLTADNAAQQARIATLKVEVARWETDIADREIALVEAGGLEAARALEASGAGKASMDAIRQTLGEMRSDEVSLLVVRAAERDHNILMSQIFLAAGAFLSAALSIALGLTLTRLIARPVRALNTVVTKMASGDLAVTVEGQDRRDELGDLAKAAQILKDNSLRARALEAEAADLRAAADTERGRGETERRLVEAEQTIVIGALASSLGLLAQGDLTGRIEVEFGGKFSQIRFDFNAAVDSLKETIGVIGGNASAIHSEAGEISKAADDLSRRTEKQAATLEQTAAALDQITATVKRTAEGADRAGTVVAEAKSAAEQSGQVVSRAVAAMGEIERSSDQITQIIGVIDEIAFQTNLLALNAGVEAARAGDAGRGFAVVASEVRALAQRSAEAAKEIKSLIAASSGQVKAGVGLVGETGEALTAIVERVAEINGLMAEITASAKEQAMALTEVNTAVNQMDQTTQQNAAMVEQSTAASQNLSQEAEELAALVSRFKVGEGGAIRRRGNAVHAAQARIEAEVRPSASRTAAVETHRPAPQSVGNTALKADEWESF
ncbi:MAG: methyl-accepting chemotaxis protein [Caulobacter sp.]|nr:methyl-accepting chemotaxis protein [Caulobacter sp.]